MQMIILVLLLVFSATANAQIFGEKNPKPLIPYEYYGDIATGLSTRGWYFTWKVTNGKIKDQNGNFTLTTLDTSSFLTTIEVMWDCAESGRIEVERADESLNPSLIPY